MASGRLGAEAAVVVALISRILGACGPFRRRQGCRDVRFSPKELQSAAGRDSWATSNEGAQSRSQPWLPTSEMRAKARHEDELVGDPSRLRRAK